MAQPKTQLQGLPYNFLWIGMGVVLLLVFLETTRQPRSDTISYSEFLKALDQGSVESIAVGETKITGLMRASDDQDQRKFETLRVDPHLDIDWTQFEVEVEGVAESGFWLGVFGWLLPFLFIVLIWILLLRFFASRGGLGGGSFMAVGKSKAKIYVESDVRVSFADVAGVDEAKQELQEVVNFLKNPKEYSRLGARMPKGVLLVGPPGTGKTLLARAVAGEAAVTFFSISGSEFVEMFVGVGAARVRDLFEQARSKAPCIIFIDELDALGRARAAGTSMSSHDEKEQTLNQLLVELDGFDSSSGIVLLAASNRPEILDPALLRAGRFDRQVLVDRPERNGRVAILKVHVKRITKLDKSVDLEAVAALTPGFTGADLANLVNEAALHATRHDAEAVRQIDFTAAIERIVAGLEKRNRLLNPNERNVVAHHEMGHALVAASLPGMDKVHKVSIIPRGIGALGYTIQRPTEDRYLMSRAELENKIKVLLGGRAAEMLCFSDVSTGAADDLQKATDIARSMVTRYGMDENLGSVSYVSEGSSQLYPGLTTPRPYSENTARELDQAIKEIISKALQDALAILRDAEDLLRESAQTLIDEETLDEASLQRFFTRLKKAETQPSESSP